MVGPWTRPPCFRKTGQGLVGKRVGNLDFPPRRDLRRLERVPRSPNATVAIETLLIANFNLSPVGN